VANPASPLLHDAMWARCPRIDCALGPATVDERPLSCQENERYESICSTGIKAQILKYYIEKNIKGFTVVHGHFMQMGGFMLYLKGARFGIIEDYNELVSAIVDWKFVLPTAEEIRDRSKGDGLAKALVVGQTAWFVAQCLSRCLAGLAITEIELVTLAFAALNGIIYFLWWNKPLDVRYAVQVIRQTEGKHSVASILDLCTKNRQKIMSKMLSVLHTKTRSPQPHYPLS
jgi:hypothetical protein